MSSIATKAMTSRRKPKTKAALSGKKPTAFISVGTADPSVAPEEKGRGKAKTKDPYRGWMRQVSAVTIDRSFVSRDKGYKTDGLVQFSETQHTSLKRGNKAREECGNSATRDFDTIHDRLSQ